MACPGPADPRRGHPGPGASLSGRPFDDDRAPLDVETALYRIAQEALHNVVKHAEARNVSITLGGSRSEGFRLAVEDDGRGFDPSVIPTGHVGIAGMRARASEIGATITVTSAATAGSRVEVFVPPTRSMLAEESALPGGSVSSVPG